MVTDIDRSRERLATAFSDFHKFLKESRESVSNKNGLSEYLNYIRENETEVKGYLDSLSKDNVDNLFELLRGISRFFSEFDWHNDMDFYNKSRIFLTTISEERHILINCFKK